MTTQHKLSSVTVASCFMAAALTVWSVNASAAVVRGRLSRIDAERHQIVAAGLSVSVQSMGSGTRAPVVITNSEGMYYIYGVAAGSYYLEVWPTQGANGKPLRYEIRVSEPFSDIPPIVLP